jgi:hypothetical protein
MHQETSTKTGRESASVQENLRLLAMLKQNLDSLTLEVEKIAFQTTSIYAYSGR